MLTEADDQDPAECISAAIETQEHTHRNGVVTRFIVYLRRADGENVPICVETTDQAIELVRSMNPARICVRVDNAEDRGALLRAFIYADVDDKDTQRRTLH